MSLQRFKHSGWGFDRWAERPVPTADSMLYTFTSYSTFYELYVALLKGTIAAAVAMSVLVSLDRLWKVVAYVGVCFKQWRTGQAPENQYSCQPLPDPAKYSLVYPRVAVQLPMFNEKAVCQAIIDSACELAWPRERLCIQVWSFMSLPFNEKIDLRNTSA